MTIVCNVIGREEWHLRGQLRVPHDHQGLRRVFEQSPVSRRIASSGPRTMVRVFAKLSLAGIRELYCSAHTVVRSSGTMWLRTVTTLPVDAKGPRLNHTSRTLSLVGSNEKVKRRIWSLYHVRRMPIGFQLASKLRSPSCS